MSEDTGWRSGDGPPSITSPEGQKRLRESGVPLDEWSSINGPDMARDRMEYRRKLDQHKRIGIVLLIIAVIAFIAYEIGNGSSPSGDEPYIEQEETPFSPAHP